METAVAVIMGSLTVVRNLLVHQTKSNHVSPAGPEEEGRRAYRMRLLQRNKNKNIDDSTRSGHLPEVPGPTLTGLRTFIRRNRREPGHETQVTQASTLVPEETYYMMPSPEHSRVDPREHVHDWGQHVYQARSHFPCHVVLFRH